MSLATTGGLMVYDWHIPPEDIQEAKDALERLANALYATEGTDTMASIIQVLQDNHEAAAYLLGRMLHQDSHTLRG